MNYIIPKEKLESFIKQFLEKDSEEENEFTVLHTPTSDPKNRNGYDWLDRVIGTLGVVFHPGRDYNRGFGSNDEGDPVFALADGEVTFYKENDGGWGNHMFTKHEINHKKFGKIKVWTHNAHLKKAEVKAGDKIKGGDIIARVGNTGSSTSPHLHYELRKKTLGTSFYPWGKSIQWVKDNYFSPDEFFKA